MKIGIYGICGKMGKLLYQVAQEENIKVKFGIDPEAQDMLPNTFIYANKDFATASVDVLIDFSNHSAIDDVLQVAKRLKCPLLIGTTGHTVEELAKIYEAGNKIPILISPNTSLGATYLINASKEGAELFGKKGYQIDILETHHINKKDAPSGTSLALFNAILSVIPTSVPIFSFPAHGKRKPNQVSIISRRMGDIVGEHEVSFCGNGEILTIKHEVFDRKVFAVGALEFAKLLCHKPAGIYYMCDLVGKKCDKKRTFLDDIKDNQK